ncbi:hypothetical protein J3A83DRAFT_4379734 [Scleroderma citrinum]
MPDSNNDFFNTSSQGPPWTQTGQMHCHFEHTLPVCTPTTHLVQAACLLSTGSTTEPESDTPVQVQAPHLAQSPPALCLTPQHPSTPCPTTPSIPAAVQLVSPGFTTEPESDTDLKCISTPHPTTPSIPATVQLASPGSIIEPESDAPVQAQSSEPSQPVSTPHPASQHPSLTKSNIGSADVPLTQCLCVHKTIFATPSPPPPGSLYWKYITHEEDARWYDQEGKNSSFDMVWHWKQELEELQDVT